MTPDPQATLASDVDPDSGSQGDMEVQADLRVEEILVEEVSIDGLCGVY